MTMTTDEWAAMVNHFRIRAAYPRSPACDYHTRRAWELVQCAIIEHGWPSGTHGLALMELFARALARAINAGVPGVGGVKPAQAIPRANLHLEDAHRVLLAELYVEQAPSEEDPIDRLAWQKDVS